MPNRTKAAAAAEEATSEQPVGDDGVKPVKQQVREAFEGGQTRRQIADAFELSYQRVYQLTKDLGDSEGQPRARVMVEASEKLTEAGREDLVGRPRVEVARELFEEGMKVGDIARLLGTTYQVIFQATKALREPAAEDESDAEDLDAESAVTESGEDEDDDEDADLEDE